MWAGNGTSLENLVSGKSNYKLLITLSGCSPCYRKEISLIPRIMKTMSRNSICRHWYILLLLCNAACTKVKLEEKEEEKISASNYSHNNNCRLLGTGVMVHLWNDKEYWVNTLIKWYDQQGKLSIHTRNSQIIPPRIVITIMPGTVVEIKTSLLPIQARRNS